MNDDTIVIDDVQHVIVCSIDFGIRTVLDTYVDPIIQLSFEIRSRTTCDGCRERFIEQAEKDLVTIREAGKNDSPESDVLEVCESILREWEARASDHGLIGWDEEGYYWIAAVL